MEALRITSCVVIENMLLAMLMLCLCYGLYGRRNGMIWYGIKWMGGIGGGVIR